eukprot:GHUV01007908.1.p2 GENE.GHUV01007908.1~~GHUV01007908.1.p2  ORF type:complete len:273 (+),score=74.38 GHUV01007908.1:1618-2436(+)
MGADSQLAQIINKTEQDASQVEGASITKLVEGTTPAKGIYRISVPLPPMPTLPQGFTFNQFLVVDDKPLLWHTSIKGTFPAVIAAIETVMPISELAYIGYAHCEGDECGAMNMFLDAAPNAVPISSMVEAATFGGDAFVRPPKGLADGEELQLGDMTVRYLWTPHTPHGWGTGFLYETTSSTLFAGDLFTQHGADNPPVQGVTHPKALGLKLFDITDYWVWHSKSRQHLEHLASLEPQTLLVMHGSSFKGPGCADMIRQLGELRQSLEPAAT